MDVSISKIIIHCSDTPDHLDIGAQTIHAWHRQPPFNFDGIGYHRIIRRNGVIEHGRPEYWNGAHCKGHNKDSLGICLIGRKRFTQQQMNSLAEQIQIWLQRYPIKLICGHRDLDPKKTCPNFNVKAWLEKRKLP
ncbi:MAG: N-acetylmuramoyl-L-alanine amidase [Candidatus Thiodiazotropha sp. (ex Ctena orbiculata)]|nr:N-acetylmuramoyl-L-alanine amidase [Candidatus Thiodiazotropha sp. (ex Lucina pensylvanica)]MBT3024530.1 N-acetylmuramoyl-L-alanine amidase [Candidatus Thiodiazotropha taylori]MBT3033260.1 N-acetylmuramoyl-L-alanine amidase [Candidatus Thiodiazotropha sp. (ex Lucina pensylvanica)]MBT3051267.1 N-acetylmuramoyl-L-alanine amidase [Candidatus Thiodiazotropha sp. (ex Codakia orbicularis)]